MLAAWVMGTSCARYPVFKSSGQFRLFVLSFNDQQRSVTPVISSVTPIKCKLFAVMDFIQKQKLRKDLAVTAA
jgi:hypothetical protein